MKEILYLLSNKATRKINIPAKILNNSINVSLSKLTILINNCIIKGVFPDDLKLADIKHVFKRKDKEKSLNKKNYRPVSILPQLFERIINKLIVLWKKKFSLYPQDFRNNLNAQYTLLEMIGN